MTVGTEPISHDDTKLALAWLIAPASMALIVNIEQCSRNLGNLNDALLMAAIQAANVSPITNDPALQIAYATLAQAPPYDLRRPVSISAIAHSLRMPFETARRRVQALVRAGALSVTPKGVLVTPPVLAHSVLLTSVVARHDHLKAFYFEMRTLGAVGDAPHIGPQFDSSPMRLTNRLIWDHVLRVADDLGALVGDVTNGMILLNMAQENTMGFTPAQVLAWAQDPIGLGKPIRNGQLAARLNVSTETLRRHVIALEARGLCRRGPLGLLAASTPDFRAGLDKLVLDNLVNVQRLFARLRQYGVLSRWDTPRRAAAVGQ